MVLSDHMLDTDIKNIDFQLCERPGPFWSAFRERGYLLEEARLGAKPIIRMVSPEGNTWMTSTNVSYPMVSGLVEEIAANKFLAYEIVKSAGFRIPETELLTHLQTTSESKLLETVNPVIVKPGDSFGSKGVTLDISDTQQLADAVTIARQLSKDVIIQEQVSGEEIRFTIIKGRVASVLLRQSPRVIGDGQSTVAQLIEKENYERTLLDFQYISYPQLTDRLIDGHFFQDSSILKDGNVLQLSKATMIKQGASIFDIIDEVDTTYKVIAEKIAYALGAAFITVDMFVEDYGTPSGDDNYWFNECNTSPALRLYYGDKNKKGPTTAKAIINQMDYIIRTGL